ncbi:unnamed protein product [Periconia digitata]|uniref:Uncharacterized protein n=1 Tax=Periconia digitata TaxID=1303443 RepID=A0A9W4XJ35_9PLEO|nr:unnamed protein product [Periconia digitata]
MGRKCSSSTRSLLQPLVGHINEISLTSIIPLLSRNLPSPAPDLEIRFTHTDVSNEIVCQSHPPNHQVTHPCSPSPLPRSPASRAETPQTRR